MDKKMTEDRVRIIAEALSKTAKYGTVHPGTLERIALWAAGRNPSDKLAIKDAKRKLHQVYAAFLTPNLKRSLKNLLLEAPETGEELEACCRKVLALHASTAERLPYLEAVFSMVKERVPQRERIIDLACGLNPFALPWLGLPEGGTYHAYDIDCKLATLINDFFKSRWPGAACECLDVLVQAPNEEADLALLLKSVTSLEQQEKGSAVALLRQVRARTVVVSFPMHSLGGRQRGMGQTYEALGRAIVQELGTPAEEVRIGNELFFILDRSSALN